MQMASTAAPKMIHGASTIRSLPLIRAALLPMLSAPVHAVVMTVWWRCHGDGMKTRDWPIVAAAEEPGGVGPVRRS